MPVPPPRRRAVQPRGPRPSPRVLSRETILDAAMQVLDDEGLDALTMRRVADALGTGPASLYAHVQHKDDLVEGLLDRVIGEVDISDTPDPDRWQDQLKAFARDTRTTFARHSDIARASLGTIPTGPNALPVIEWMVTVVRCGGVGEQVAAWSADILSLFVTATAYEESLENGADEGGQAAHDEQHAQMAAYMRSLDPTRFPTIVALAGPLTSGDRDDRFEFGLDMLVRGIASTVATPDRPPRRRADKASHSRSVPEGFDPSSPVRR